jgi:hypothetical protein
VRGEKVGFYIGWTTIVVVKSGREWNRCGGKKWGKGLSPIQSSPDFLSFSRKMNESY